MNNYLVYLYTDMNMFELTVHVFLD